jgi:hypothetical protein
MFEHLLLYNYNELIHPQAFNGQFSLQIDDWMTKRQIYQISHFSRPTHLSAGSQLG